MKKPLFNKVAIVGVGLIGGSLGLAIKKQKLARWVVGVSRKKANITRSLHKKAIDIGTCDLKTGVQDADLVILCSPVSVIIRQIKALACLIGPKTIVIDVGSTKSDICREGLRALGKRFVGCHPMAGSHHIGVDHADAELFTDSLCFMMNGESRVSRLWKRIGATTVVMTDKEHDSWIAQASHLPHLISFALFQGFPRRRRMRANPSIRDMARLSKSDPQLWADILISNKKKVLPVLKGFSIRLEKWRRAIGKGDRGRIVAFIDEANRNSFHTFTE